MGLRFMETRIRELVAQAWCTPENKHKEMDVVLAEAIVQNIFNNMAELRRLYEQQY